MDVNGGWLGGTIHHQHALGSIGGHDGIGCRYSRPGALDRGLN